MRVQAGVGYIELNELLRPKGLWFPLDPGEQTFLSYVSANNTRRSPTSFSHSSSYVTPSTPPHITPLQHTHTHSQYPLTTHTHPSQHPLTTHRTLWSQGPGHRSAACVPVAAAARPPSSTAPCGRTSSTSRQCCPMGPS